MVMRTGRSVEEMAFWLNASTGECSVSSFEMVFAANPCLPSVMGQRCKVERMWPTELMGETGDARRDVASNPFFVGDSVYLRL